MGASEPDGRVVIVGGGITGLAAAWALQQQGIPYAVLEAAGRWGGKVITTRRGDADAPPFIMEGGPESFVTRKPEVWQLACELGIRDQVIAARDEARSIFILTDGQPLAVPMHPIRFLTSPLLSWRGKLRLLAEPFIPPRRDPGDESLASFAARRLGAEAEERLISPLLGGIYNANPREQSVLVTAPIMRDLERAHGGLLRGMIARRKRRAAPVSDAPPARFITFANGSQTLIEALTARLTGQLRLNAPVSALRPLAAGYDVILNDGERWPAAAVILATPAGVTARILAEHFPESARLLSAIRHSSLGTAALIYRADDMAGVLPFSGVMIPRREQRRIDAVTWPSRRARERTPAGYELLRVFYGGGDPALATLPEAALIAIIQAELRDLFGIHAQPQHYVVARWVEEYAQAQVGHLDLVAAIERALPAGLFVAGASYRGLAVPDCIRQGREAAEQARQYVHQSASPAAFLSGR